MTAPNYSEDWLQPVFDAVQSEAERSNYFDRVMGHEPKKKPGTGLTAALWVQGIDPLPAASGLANTSARVVFILRIYQNMFKENEDEIDPEMMRAASNLMRRFHDDFDFDLPDIVRNVDLLGAFGVALAARAGYLNQDNTEYRIMDITVPVIINDVWPQVQ